MKLKKEMNKEQKKKKGIINAHCSLHFDWCLTMSIWRVIRPIAASYCFYKKKQKEKWKKKNENKARKKIRKKQRDREQREDRTEERKKRKKKVGVQETIKKK